MDASILRSLLNYNLTEKESLPIQLEEYELADEIVECEASIYVKIHSLKENFTQVRGLKGEFFTKDVAHKIIKSFNGCEAVELRKDNLGYKFFRLQALVNLGQPLRRLVNFSSDGGMGVGYLAYERLPHLCFHCGLMGHLIKQCPVIHEGVELREKYLQSSCLRNGGLALLWPRSLDVEVKSFSSHHIEAIIKDGNSSGWRFVGFYGHHETSKRKFSWNLMRLISGMINLSTLFMGDFNEVLHQSENVSKRRLRPNWLLKIFHQVVEYCGFIDLGYYGFPFTWCNNFVSPYSTGARLDRALASKDWRDTFPNARLSHLSTNTSDHTPIYLNLGTKSNVVLKSRSRFRFEEGWCLYEESKG
ncbi:hypothetical protein LIER_37650 [Lithospermum erythrorhizon]|uniref:CCHC-type domain-containing protein n=1 Tax=Lithospermum erythrorhizon TaxID=34254 RepID=A0AAV3PNJ0_LITER